MRNITKTNFLYYFCVSYFHFTNKLVVNPCDTQKFKKKKKLMIHNQSINKSQIEEFIEKKINVLPHS